MFIVIQKPNSNKVFLSYLITLIHFLFYHIFVLTIYHGYQKYIGHQV